MMKRRIRRPRLYCLLAAATLSPRPATSQANDPDGLCSGSRTGYAATLDCRGYVYCSDGVVLGGGTSSSNPAGVSGGSGVIACWPNQLFDESLGICTYWQNVDKGNCPGYDGGMLMPGQEDGNANKQRFFCGHSASNAKRVCEPCPGGSRLECSDPDHNCFAGITGCPTSGGSKPKPKPASVSPPATAGKPTLSQVYTPPTPPTRNPTPRPTRNPTPRPTTRRPTAPPKFTSVQIGHSPTSGDVTNGLYLHGKLRSSYYCGFSWARVIANCPGAQACPTGLSSDCPSGQTCFPDTPCEMLQTPYPTRRPTPRPISAEERNYYCGYNWNWLVNQGNCPSAVPCPGGDATGVCPQGMNCIANTPCYYTNNGLPTKPPTTPPTKPPGISGEVVETDDPQKRYCGHDWQDVTESCLTATPCPLGFAEGVCPQGMKCISNTLCADEDHLDYLKQKQASYGSGNVWDTAPGAQQGASRPSGQTSRPPPTNPPVDLGDPAKRFCGKDWDDVTDNCLTATPCPGMFADSVCPFGMKCIAETPCNDEAYLDWLRKKQQQPASVNPPSSAAAASKPAPQQTPQGPLSQPTTAAVTGDSKRCGNNRDCPTGQFCNIEQAGLAGFCGQCVTDTGMGCSVDEVCRTSSCTSPMTGPAKCYDKELQHTICRNSLQELDATCNLRTMECEVNGIMAANHPDSLPSPAGDVGSLKYDNPKGNIFFCGVRLADITSSCLESKPCANGRSSGVCESHEGCFAESKCMEEYESAKSSASVSASKPAPASSPSPPTPNPVPAHSASDPIETTVYENPEDNVFFCGRSFATIKDNCLESKPCIGGRGAGVCESHEGCFSSETCRKEYASAVFVDVGSINFVTSTSAPSPPTAKFAPPTSKPVPPTAKPTLPTFSLSIGQTKPVSKDETTQSIPITPAPTRSTPSPTTPAPSLQPQTPAPSLAPIVNNNFCGASWNDVSNYSGCATSIPCPRGDECPADQQCFNGSPCPTLLDQGPLGVQESSVGDFCGTSWNLLITQCEAAKRCPNGNECQDGELCYRNFVCDPPNTAMPTRKATSAPTINQLDDKPAADFNNNNEKPSVPTTTAPSDSPVINTNFCGSSWNAVSTLAGCETSRPCPKGNECPKGHSCFTGTPCSMLMNPLGEEQGDSKIGNFCGSSWNTLRTGCETAMKCPTGTECGAGEFCYQDFVCDPPTAPPSPSSIGEGNRHDQPTESLWEALTGAKPSSGSSGSLESGSDEGVDTVGTISMQNYCGISPEQIQTICATSSIKTCNDGDSPCPLGSYCFPNIACQMPATPNSSTGASGTPSNGSSSDSTLAEQPAAPTTDQGQLDASPPIKDNEQAMQVADSSTAKSSPPPTSKPTSSPKWKPGGEQSQAAQNESCSICGNIGRLDWEISVDYNGNSITCGEFEWIFSAENIFENSNDCISLRSQYFSKCCLTMVEGDGCNLCDSGTDNTWYDMREGGDVLLDGEFITCPELAARISKRFDKSSMQCSDTRNEHFNECCYEKCDLCDGGTINYEASVNFSGEEVPCHELNSRVFVEHAIASGSSRCEMSQGFYAEACCFTAPAVPCSLCQSGDLYYEIETETVVSYDGEEHTCLDIFHLLHSRREQTSAHCTSAQGALFSECCSARATESDSKYTPSPSPWVWKASVPDPGDPGFDSWYAGALQRSPSAKSAISFITFVLSASVGLML